MKKSFEEIRSDFQRDTRHRGLPDETDSALLFRRMLFIRRFEERLLQLFELGRLNGTIHACIGQEANCVGIIRHLREGDHIFSTHRCHGHYLAWTGDGLGMLGEMMGSPNGACGGLGGSQHLSAPGFKSNGVLGGTLPAAAGIAFAKKLRGSPGVSVAFIGDGSLGEGVVYETLNLTSLWQLPLFVIVENNGWSQSTPLKNNLAGSVPARLEAFGLPVAEITSTDVEEISKCAAEQLEVLRRSRSPRALIVNTYRLCSHSKNDDNRPADEVRARWEFEPLKIQSSRLAEGTREKITSEIEQVLDEIFLYAQA